MVYKVEVQFTLTRYWLAYDGQPKQQIKTIRQITKGVSNLEAIDYVKDAIQDEYEGLFYPSPSCEIQWSTATASRVDIPDSFFFEDRVVLGQGWASDGFILIPEKMAVWDEAFGSQIRGTKIDDEVLRPFVQNTFTPLDFVEYLFDDSGYPEVRLDTSLKSVFLDRQFYDDLQQNIEGQWYMCEQAPNEYIENPVVIRHQGELKAAVMPRSR